MCIANYPSKKMCIANLPEKPYVLRSQPAAEQSKRHRHRWSPLLDLAVDDCDWEQLRVPMFGTTSRLRKSARNVCEVRARRPFGLAQGTLMIHPSL